MVSLLQDECVKNLLMLFVETLEGSQKHNFKDIVPMRRTHSPLCPDFTVFVFVLAVPIGPVVAKRSCE